MKSPLPLRLLLGPLAIAASLPFTAYSQVQKETTQESEPLTAQISAHIKGLAENERNARIKFMNIVIDDISRLCELNHEQQEKIHLAAKGAAERSMNDWHLRAEAYFRTRLEGQDRDAVKELLEGMGNVDLSNKGSEEKGESSFLWKYTLDDVLTKEQIERYDALLKQREKAQIEAFTMMSLSMLDSHLRLSPLQKEKLKILVHQSATDHLSDVLRYWGDYIETDLLMSFLNASKEEDVKKILSEAQFKRLQQSTANYEHFWKERREQNRTKEGNE